MSLEALCLATAIFFESRGEPLKGQYSVAEVVLNRRDNSKYPNTICKVVSQKNQFSWQKGDNHKRVPNIVYKNESHKQEWDKAVKIANDSLKNKTEYTKGALFFNRSGLGVRYKTDVKPCKIGNHIFY